MNLVLMLSLLVVITAVLATRGEYLPTRTHVYIFKPVTTILIIIIAVVGIGDMTQYDGLIVIGLIFCLGGDVFLMLPERFFIMGLVSFLIGHIFYIVAFVTDSGFFLAWWIFPLLVYGGIVYSLLHGHLGKMRNPVIVYVLIILVMAWQALGRWSAEMTTGTLLAAVGAMAFVISDSVLALDRFRQKFRAARVIVLSTYWLAQWLIALSAGAYLALI